MTFFLIIVLIVGAIIAFIYLSDKNAGKDYGQVQRKVAASMYGMYVKDMPDPLDESRRTEARIQAGIVGDHLTETAINDGTYTGPLPERRDDGGWLSIYDNLRILKIAGINHRQGISRYVGRVECALVPEPDNEYDPDAIKIVAEDRHHLGYIPSGQTEMVCWLAANEFPYRCTAFIEAHEDETDGHKFFTGYVYIKRLD
jgi:hypothetical protein